MARYWCDDCMVWAPAEEVTEEKEVLKRGQPPTTVYWHDDCGFYVKPEEEMQ